MANLRIATEALFQLGRELITDDAMALGELIKNAYDADAKSCTVDIVTRDEKHKYSQFDDQGGYILIEDDGLGMTAKQILDRWLHISFSHKRVFDESGKKKKTKENRTPLGDKGLGRLGAQRLGTCLEIFTKSEGAPAAGAAIRWPDYEGSQDLTKVIVDTTQATKKAQEVRIKQGTTILISGLTIQATNLKQRLEPELSKLLSPVPRRRGFKITIQIDDELVDLTQLRKELRDQAPIYYNIDWKQTENLRQLEVQGFLKLNALRVDKKKQPYFDKYVKGDDGDAFYAFLVEQAVDPAHGRLSEGPSGYFVEYKATYHLDQMEDRNRGIKGVQFDQSSPDQLPGPFEGKAFYYDIRLFKEQEDDSDKNDEEVSLSEADRIGAIQALVDNLAGVHVYRDGFEVGVDSDWLDMAEGVQRTGSYYDLRPSNTVGYIDITAENNPQLKEVTDRQSLLENDAYLAFRLILRQFVIFASYWQRKIRRKLNQFLVARMEEDLEVAEHTPQSLAAEIKKDIQTVGMKVPAGTVKEILARLEQKVDLVAQKFDLADDEKSRYIRLAGVGLTAASLQHELEIAAPRLRADLNALKAAVKKRDQEESMDALDAVISNFNRVLKQMSFILPTLRYVQERRVRFNLRDEVEAVAEYWRNRFEATDIEVKGDSSAQASLVKMPKSIFLQVMANLLNNSDYWSKRGKNRPKITIKVDGPKIHVTDSGPGVIPELERVIFEPAVSGRPEGTGLGLHIGRHVLSGIGCTLDLTGPRHDGRRNQFTIDLAEVLDG